MRLYHENTWPLIKVGVTFFSGRSVTIIINKKNDIQKNDNDDKRLDGLLDNSTENSDVNANFGFVQACH